MPLIRARRKIAAVKKVREITGWGLRQAKDYVDHLVEGTPKESNDEYA
jgi:ribosomal protein L7/L12